MVADHLQAAAAADLQGMGLDRREAAALEENPSPRFQAHLDAPFRPLAASEQGESQEKQKQAGE
jgi:hypothetical protein